MFCLLVLLNLVLCNADDDFGTNLVAYMRNDANLDLSVDEEYEDLRAELLAYHTALATLSSKRRSMISTPCWSLGGICVNYKLCTGFRYLTEVPGCKDKHTVCCFAWNKFKVKDWRHKGLGTVAMPWSEKFEFGGLGVVSKDDKKKDESETNIKLTENSNEQEQSVVGISDEENDVSKVVDQYDNNIENDEENKDNMEINNNAKHGEYGKVQFVENISDKSVEVDKIQFKDENNDNIDKDSGKDEVDQDNVVGRNGRNKLGKVKKKSVALILRANK